MDYAADTIRAPLWVYFLIPVVNAAAFYVTNVAMMKTVFYPIEFYGWKLWQPEGQPFGLFGWQGIVPSQLKQKIGKIVHAMTEMIIKVKDTLERMDTIEIANRLEKGSRIITQEALQDIVQIYIPGLWATLPKYAREDIVSYVDGRSKIFIVSMIQALSQSMPDLFDMDEVIQQQITLRKRNIVISLQKVGEPEYRFIQLSGIWYGLLFGAAQAILLYFYGAWWIFLLSGLLFGFLARLLAISYVYEPAEPQRIGCLQLQGLFAQHQSEAAVKIADLFEKEFLKSEYIFQAVMKGKNKVKFSALVDTTTEKYVECVAAPAEKIVMPIFLGADGDKNIRMAVARAVKKHLPTILEDIYDTLDEDWGFADHLQAELQSLNPTEFVSAMRLMHQGEELQLIIMGAIQGFVLGLIMYFILSQWNT